MTSEILKKCAVCPLECGADRFSSRGACGAGAEVEVSSFNLHFGEEPPVSGDKGSGTIFFTHCPLKCVFCQNYPISHLGHGKGVSEERLIDIMLELQEKGAHNINLVTPTHYTPQIVSALRAVKGKTLKIPVIYNSSGYDKTTSLRKLEGLIDIYMPDMKFSVERSGDLVCSISDYIKVNREALFEMYRQVGDFRINKEGVAVRGLIIRHLVLPGGISGTEKVLGFISRKLGKGVYLSLMAQYHPAGGSVGDPLLGRRLEPQEYEAAVYEAERLGLENCYTQDF